MKSKTDICNLLNILLDKMDKNDSKIILKILHLLNENSSFEINCHIYVLSDCDTLKFKLIK